MLENLDREIGRYAGEQERLRRLQQAQERAALALDHENRKLAEETARSSQRLSVARLALDRLRKESERALTQRERDRLAVEDKDAARQVEEQVLEQARAARDELQRESAGLG